MTEVLFDLAARLRAELADLGRTAELAQRRWSKARSDDYLGSVALDLQSFYQGVERSLDLIAKTVDGRVPSGEQWHHDLLAQMAEEIDGVRPAVVSEGTRPFLDRLRLSAPSLLRAPLRVMGSANSVRSSQLLAALCAGP